MSKAKLSERVSFGAGVEGAWRLVLRGMFSWLVKERSLLRIDGQV